MTDAVAADGLYAGQVAAVTGSRRGLGRTIAQHFLDHGAEVIGIARGESSIEHPRYHHHAADVGDADAVRRVFAAIGKSHGRLNILVNNAGVLTAMHAMLMPVGAAQSMVQTNLMGTFLVSREAARLMRRAPAGRIVNIGSMAEALEEPGDAIYAATKAAVTAMAGVLARELAGFRITVNTVGVTAIETDMLAQLPRDRIDAVIRSLPIPRYAEAADVLNVIDFFVSPRSGYVTGQTVYLGGVH